MSLCNPIKWFYQSFNLLFCTSHWLMASCMTSSNDWPTLTACLVEIESLSHIRRVYFYITTANPTVDQGVVTNTTQNWSPKTRKSTPGVYHKISTIRCSQCPELRHVFICFSTRTINSIVWKFKHDMYFYQLGST